MSKKIYGATVATPINPNKMGSVTDDQITSVLESYLEEHPIEVETTSVEPAEDDIPKVFFGGVLQQTKDEAVVPFRYISKTQDISGYAEIKAQGNSSLGYAKKNQTVKMFEDAECDEKLKVDFKGWGKQNKHVYKANWIDLTHARNVVSARLWGDVVKSRANYEELPELLRTSPNQGAVDGFPVKVYADGIYQGRYTLNIPKDGWMANMDKKLSNHCILCGEGYLSGCFRSASMSEWTDEVHDTRPESINTRWLEIINFVMNSTDEEFRANLNQYFYVDSLVDYYLFGLASCGLDAFGKNQLYMTYDGQRWIASMYDMDSTWGLYWNGGKFVGTDYARTSFEDMVGGRQGNLLYIRLEQLFGAELQNRWAELRSGALSIENIINRFERFTDITPDELVKEDYATTTGGGKFTGIPSKDTNNIQQLRSFALARQAWTDDYVTGLTNSENPPEEPDNPEVTLSSISATYAGGDVTAGTSVNDLIGIVVTAHYSDGSTSNVTDYILSGTISEGNNTVTVSYGGQTVTFTVTGTVAPTIPGQKNVLATDYMPNGEKFTLYEGSIDLEKEKIVSVMDLSTCEGTSGVGENVFSLAPDLTRWSTGVHIYFNAKTKDLKKDDTVLQPNQTQTVTLTDLTNVTIEITKLGVSVNGELCSNDWADRAATVSSKTMQIGAREGSTPSNATYKSVYIETI